MAKVKKNCGWNYDVTCSFAIPTSVIANYNKWYVCHYLIFVIYWFTTKHFAAYINALLLSRYYDTIVVVYFSHKQSLYDTMDYTRIRLALICHCC